LRYIEVAKLEDIPEGEILSVKVDGEPISILLANVKGRIFAVQDRCGHMSAPLSMGKLKGTIIECPLHRAKFDVTTGKCIEPPMMGGLEGVFIAATHSGRVTDNIPTIDIPKYKTRVRKSIISVGIPECD
jgi:nitrite reductase/ring-hydroxylating ferredoxin subunit